MTYQVWHAVNPNFQTPNAATKGGFPKGFNHVADVEAGHLDEVYQLTNNIDSSWLENPGVTPRVVTKGCRSTSVGDIIVDDNGINHSVASFGFEAW